MTFIFILRHNIVFLRQRSQQLFLSHSKHSAKQNTGISLLTEELIQKKKKKKTIKKKKKKRKDQESKRQIDEFGFLAKTNSFLGK